MDETAKKKLRAKVMLQAMMFGVQEIAREDPGVQAQLKGWDRIIQYSVLPDGPDMHFVTKDGTITAVHGKNDKATASVQFVDLDTAVGIFSRKLDPSQAFMQGKVKLVGEMADAMKITMVTQLAQAYFT